MTPNSTVLTSSVTPSSSISVLTASGAFVPVRQVGSVTRSSDPSGRLSLDAVYHVVLECYAAWDESIMLLKKESCNLKYRVLAGH